jgi:hypothetical protein
MKKAIVPALVLTLGVSALAAGSALAEQNDSGLFGLNEVAQNGQLLANHGADHKCGADKCAKDKGHKCAADKGDHAHKDAGHKCAADKCASHKDDAHKDAGHKCAADKCGAEKKH